MNAMIVSNIGLFIQYSPLNSTTKFDKLFPLLIPMNNNKCYDIDRWKIYFDSNNLFKDFLSTKTNFDNIAKEAKNIFDKTEDSKKLEDMANKIDLSSYTKGVYFISMLKENEVFMAKKIIIN